MADWEQILITGFFILSLVFVMTVWVLLMYPHNLISAFFGRKKEWWQDRYKRIDQEIAETKKSHSKAKKG